MRLRRETKSRRIINAAVADGLSYIVGLALTPLQLSVPLPLGTIKKCVQIIGESSPFNYVDWELRNWPEIYSGELSASMKLLFRGKEYLLPQVLLFNNTERKLDLEQVVFQLEKRPFEPPDPVKGLTEKAFQRLFKALKRRKVYYSDENVRLIDIVEKDGKLVLKVQPVEYKWYVHTNLVLDAKIGKSDTLREYLHSNGKLEKLSKSSLANNLGINILLFTADGSLIMKKRKRVAFRVGELDPSASGTICSADLPTPPITLDKMPHLREALEELGIVSGHISQTFLLGFTRELIRGGEPEIFIFARTNLTENQIKNCWKSARDKHEAKDVMFYNFGRIAFEILDNDQKKHSFLLKVDDFLERHIEKASITLLTIIAFWVQYRLQLKHESSC